jgi:formiminoglutamase
MPTPTPAPMLPEDELWPRAGRWIQPAPDSPTPPCDLALLGVPAHLSSISPSGADATPDAVRAALLRCSTWAGGHDVSVAALAALDFGDVQDPDGSGGHERVTCAVARAARADLLLAIGGDNSITFSVARARLADLGASGLITLDAHHDLRDGVSNGSPVRQLIEVGLPGENVVQIGIADFSNSAAYAARARDLGITVVHRSQMRRRSMEDVAVAALEVASAGGRPVFVDIDVDVCDRAEVPACPAAAPGGLSADEVRHLAFLLASDPRVTGVDITEVDATADATDGRTVRLVALLVLEVAAGLAVRRTLHQA